MQNIPVEIKNALTGPRLDEYRFELLNREERPLGNLDTVEGGRIDASIFSVIRSGGAIELTESNARCIDFLNNRLRIYYRLLVGNRWHEWPLGVFLMASPIRVPDGQVIKRSVEMYDKLKILTDDILEHTYTVAQGTKVTDAVRIVIEGAGESAIAITPSEETVLTDRTWPPGTSRLQIANDLLASINYFSLHVGGFGNYRATPYVSPVNRNIAWVFKDDKQGLYSPELSVDVDYFKVPNKVVLVLSDPEEEPIVVKAENQDSNSPYSYQTRGRWIVDYRDDMEATGEETLQARADRILAEGMQITESIDYNHAWVPITLNDAVHFENSQLQLSAKYTIVEQSIPLVPGELVQSIVRRVVT